MNGFSSTGSTCEITKREHGLSAKNISIRSRICVHRIFYFRDRDTVLICDLFRWLLEVVHLHLSFNVIPCWYCSTLELSSMYRKTSLSACKVGLFNIMPFGTRILLLLFSLLVFEVQLVRRVLNCDRGENTQVHVILRRLLIKAQMTGSTLLELSMLTSPQPQALTSRHT